MEVSSTSMKVASMTETAIIHGLEVGRETVMPGEPATVVLAILGSLREKVGGRGRSTRSQRYVN